MTAGVGQDRFILRPLLRVQSLFTRGGKTAGSFCLALALLHQPLREYVRSIWTLISWGELKESNDRKVAKCDRQDECLTCLALCSH